MDYTSQLYHEAKEKLPEPDGEHCIICSKKLPKREQKYCSEKCWTTWYDSLNIPSWIKIRNGVLKRDKYTCRLCGKKSRAGTYNELECDHIIPTATAWKILKRLNLSIRELHDRYIWNPDNLRTLCKECHRIVTNGFIKKKARLELIERQKRCKEHQVKGDGNDKYFDGYKEEDLQFMVTQGIARWVRYIERDFILDIRQTSLLGYVESTTRTIH